MKQATAFHLSKFIEAWKQFVEYQRVEAIQKEEAKVRAHQMKEIWIEKERKRTLRELAKQANSIRNKATMKSCFEVLKKQIVTKRKLESKLKAYEEHRDK